jgi:hypothetical protein
MRALIEAGPAGNSVIADHPVPFAVWPEKVKAAWAEDSDYPDAERRRGVHDSVVVTEKHVHMRKDRQQFPKRDFSGARGGKAGRRRETSPQAFRIAEDHKVRNLIGRLLKGILKALDGPLADGGAGAKMQTDERPLSRPSGSEEPLHRLISFLLRQNDLRAESVVRASHGRGQTAIAVCVVGCLRSWGSKPKRMGQQDSCGDSGIPNAARAAHHAGHDMFANVIASSDYPVFPVSVFAQPGNQATIVSRPETVFSAIAGSPGRRVDGDLVDGWIVQKQFLQE